MRRLVGLTVLLGARAFAYDVGTTAGDSSVVTRVDRGAKLLGLEAVAVVDYNAQGGASTLRATALGGLGFDYFVRNNLALGVSVYGYYKRSTDAADVTVSEYGAVGLLTVHYYARLGEGFFLRPGIAVGGFYGQHHTPLGGGVDDVARVIGGSGSVDLGLVFFATPHVMLQAAPQVVVFAGSDGTALALSVDAGFNIGLRYVF